MPYSFAAFEHLADVGRAPSPAAGAPAGLLPYATTLLSARPAGPGAPRRPGGLPHKRTSTQLAVEKLYGIGLKACPTGSAQVFHENDFIVGFVVEQLIHHLPGD